MLEFIKQTWKRWVKPYQDSHSDVLIDFVYFGGGVFYIADRVAPNNTKEHTDEHN